jgi:hypothetical protein
MESDMGLKMNTIYESDEEVREAIISAFDSSTGRGDFLRTVLKVGGGLAAFGVGASLLAPHAVDAASLGLSAKLNSKGVPQSDLDILNYALTLEHIEATFYAGVKAADAPTRQALTYVKIIATHEKAHVDALTAAITKLGGMPVAAKKYNFPKISFPFGIIVENLGVGAYLGAAPMIKTPAILLTAASIVTVEARHAAAWAELNQEPDFTRGAFDAGIPSATVVKAVTPFFAM